MDKNFGGVVWTNHALDRLRERAISQGDAWATFQRPDQSRYAAAKGAWVYYKTYSDQKIEVVAKQNDRKEWVILTVWSRPVDGRSPYADNKKKKKHSLFGLILRRLLGIKN